MTCIKNFSFLSSANENITAPELDTWGLAPQNYWRVSILGGGTTSTFNIQGFKNVNVHGIEAVGNFQSLVPGTQNVLVQDWSFYLRVNGQNPQIGGFITPAPNRFSIVKETNNPLYELSKYNPEFQFTEPIQSVTSIQLIGFRASGIGAEDLLNVNLAWNMSFVVYYSFEGE